MTGGGVEGLETALETLKADGASVLVAGPAPDEYIDRVSASHLGAEDTDVPRRRFFALFARDPAVAQRRLQYVDSDLALDRRQLLYSSPDRSTAVEVAGPGPRTGFGPTATSPSSLSAVVGAVEESIAAEREREGLAPGQYRLCVDSLIPVLDENGLENTLEFVTAVNDAIYDASGHVHFVLPLALDADVTRELAGAIDVFVPLQARGGDIHYRFEITDTDRVPSADGILTTSWRPVAELP